MSIYIKPVLCALAAAIAVPVVYTFLVVALDDRLTALGAFFQSYGNASEVQRSGGAVALLLVVFPALALLGAMSAAWVWRREWSLRARRGWSGAFAILSGLCVVPLAYVAPFMTESTMVGRAVPAAPSANRLVHWIVNFESWAPVLWATVLSALCLWSWNTARTR